MAHLITGYAGFEHIMSADQGSFNAAFFGGGCFVMESGNMMEASIINNNTVRVLDGDLLMYGRHIRIEPNTYEDITIDTGTAGKERFDLIVMTYEKNTSDGTETARLEVIKGTPSDGSPITPVYTDGNILEGATVCQFPLYKVHINGVVLEEVEQRFKTVSTFQTTAEQYEAEFQEACDTYLGSLNILDTMEEVNANTQPNQLAGALAVKELFQFVSNGKSLLASAITDKGVPTAAGATFQQMANNIAEIQTGSNTKYLNADADFMNASEWVHNWANYVYQNYFTISGTTISHATATNAAANVNRVSMHTSPLIDADGFSYIKGQMSIPTYSSGSKIEILGEDGAVIGNMGSGGTVNISAHQKFAFGLVWE